MQSSTIVYKLLLCLASFISFNSFKSLISFKIFKIILRNLANNSKRNFLSSESIELLLSLFFSLSFSRMLSFILEFKEVLIALEEASEPTLFIFLFLKVLFLLLERINKNFYFFKNKLAHLKDLNLTFFSSNLLFSHFFITIPKIFIFIL